ncbi:MULTISPECIES: hypothetical protein [unclassified Tychonema]|nr:MULTISPECIES: hypothetical protein [unclassified Tychonema]
MPRLHPQHQEDDFQGDSYPWRTRSRSPRMGVSLTRITQLMNELL